MGCDIEWGGASDYVEPQAQSEAATGTVLSAAGASDDRDDSPNEGGGDGRAAAAAAGANKAAASTASTTASAAASAAASTASAASAASARLSISSLLDAIRPACQYLRSWTQILDQSVNVCLQNRLVSVYCIDCWYLFHLLTLSSQVLNQWYCCQEDFIDQQRPISSYRRHFLEFGL